jgi:PilZ domain-containing protein
MIDTYASTAVGNVDRSHRTSTHETCIIARENGSKVLATLVNVSDEGFCVESATPLEPHERIEVRVLGTRLSGSVRWAKQSRAGGAWEPLDD